MGKRHPQKRKHGQATDMRRAQSALDRGLTALSRDDLATALRELAVGWTGLKSEAARAALVEATRRAAPELARRADPDSVELLRHAVELAPADSELRRYLAKASWSAGRLDQASAALDPLLHDLQHSPLARLALALVRARQGLPEVASKLLGPVSAAGVSADPAGAGEGPVRLLVELALALDARDASVLHDLSGEQLTRKERNAILYSVTSRREAAARWFLSEAKEGLEKVSASCQRACELALEASSAAPEELPLPAVRMLLDPLIAEFERRLQESSRPHPATRMGSWVAASARLFAAIERGAPVRTELPGDTPPDLALSLEIGLAAAQGDAAGALAVLLERTGELPDAAARAMAEAIVPALPMSHFKREQAIAISQRWPELSDRIYSARAAQSLREEHYADALEDLRSIQAQSELHRLHLAVTLALAGRQSEALSLWEALLEAALRRSPGEDLPVWFHVALVSVCTSGRASRHEIERIQRRALALAPGDLTVRLLLAKTVLASGRMRDREEALDLLEGARPPDAQKTCELARMLSKVGSHRRAMELLASLPEADRPPDFARQVDALVRDWRTAGMPAREELAVMDAADRLRPPGPAGLLDRADLLEEMDLEPQATAARRLAAQSADPADPGAVAIALRVLQDEDLEEARALLRQIPAQRLAALPLTLATEVLAELAIDPQCIDRWTRLDKRLDVCANDRERSDLLLLVLTDILEIENGCRHQDVLDDLVQRIRLLRQAGRELLAAIGELSRHGYRTSDEDPGEQPFDIDYEVRLEVLRVEEERVRRRSTDGRPCRVCGGLHPAERHADENKELRAPVTTLTVPEPPRELLEKIAMAWVGHTAQAKTRPLADAVRSAVVSVAARAVGLEN